MVLETKIWAFSVLIAPGMSLLSTHKARRYMHVFLPIHLLLFIYVNE